MFHYLQEKLYEEIVQRFGPDEEFDEKLEKRLRKRSQIKQEEEEAEIMRQETEATRKLKPDTEVLRNRIQMKQEEEEELLRQYDLVDIPIRPNLSPGKKMFITL